MQFSAVAVVVAMYYAMAETTSLACLSHCLCIVCTDLSCNVTCVTSCDCWLEFSTHDKFLLVLWSYSD